MSPGKFLGVDYLTPHELTMTRDSGWVDVLGIAVFTTGEGLSDTGKVPTALVKARPLSRQPSVCEVWRATGPFRTGASGIVQYRTNDHLAFGCITIQESSSEGTLKCGVDLRSATARAYTEIFGCLAQIGFPHLLRIWNYLPDINQQTVGLERYRQFNEGRQKTFQTFSRIVKGHVPAACALGAESAAPLVVYFVASSAASVAIENPRQVAAYDYPPKYGDFSPVFSRATLLHTDSNAVLFVSGTSSIVGHHTVHIGDVVGQTHETVRNIQAVIEAANQAVDDELFMPEKIRYKVYLRRPEDRDRIADELAVLLNPEFPVVYLKADICRNDLLVEIEAFGVTTSPGAH